MVVGLTRRANILGALRKMAKAPEISIIVPTWNTRALLATCLESIARSTEGLAVETIVVDNASTDATAAMVRERFPSVRLICNRDNVGFAKADNQAASQSTAPYFLFPFESGWAGD